MMMRYWTPEPIFAGDRVYVLGNGPSLANTDLCGIDLGSVVAVNSAIELVPAAAVLFSRDSAWCKPNQALIASCNAACKVTTKRDAARENGMHLVAMERRDDFPPPGSLPIRYGVSSGHAAVSLAVAMGARQIMLLGFDGRIVNGRSHWHDRYIEYRHEIYALFNRGWVGWHAAARRVGVEIVNATPNSAITEFPMTTSPQMANAA